MSKKLISLISLFIICISLTGCMDVIDITDTERVLIAEYAADLLLKYDINHDDRLDEGEKIEQEMIEEAEEDELNGITPVTTEAYTDPSITEESTDAATDNNGHNLNILMVKRWKVTIMGQQPRMLLQYLPGMI